MSKALKRIGGLIAKVDPLSKKIDQAILGEKGAVGGKEIAAKNAAAAEAAKAADLQRINAAKASSLAGLNKARGYAERESSIDSAAVAAGATRTGNDADVLGAQSHYVPKKKAASKTLLGG